MNWVPRDQNNEADALTSANFSALDAKKRIVADVSAIPCRVLPSMLAAADEIFERVKSARVAAAAGGGPGANQGRAKKRPLRERDPW